MVNAFEGVTRPGGATGAVDAAAGGVIGKHLRMGDFKARRGEIYLIYPEGMRTKRILLVGLGKKEKFDEDAARQVSAAVAKRAVSLKIRSYASIVHGAGGGEAGDGAGERRRRSTSAGIGGLRPERAAQAFAEGAILATYKFEKYKSAPEKPEDRPVELARITVLAPEAREVSRLARGVEAGVAIAESVNFTRDVANESGRDGRPEVIARRVQEMARKVGLKCTVYDRRWLERKGMNAILAVNSGSANEPRLVVLEHNPRAKRTVAVVGKGITFDSGGISIKPGEAMDKMKHDKSGAAAVFGALRAAALLDLPVHVVGVAPLTDNLPSGSAYKPGDIVRAYNGKTIEVLNTDAEGRVLLSDALAWTEETFAPDAIVDLATLTGACSVALGSLAIAGMGTDEKLLSRVREAGEACHERVWPLPFWDEYDEQIKTPVADVKNLGGRGAGTITGGRFLRKFVKDTPWVHLDIASTAWDEGSAAKFNPEYSPSPHATGVGVRLMVEMLRDW